MDKVLLIIATVISTWWVMDNFGDLSDRTKPYVRISEESFSVPTSPSNCGKPDGPVPLFIRTGDCVTVKWRTVFYKDTCFVSPLRPYVLRKIVDHSGRQIDLPRIPSQFKPGVMQVVAGTNLSKSYIQPQVDPGKITYTAEVCYICPMKNGMDNPIDWIFPRCVTDGHISYYVHE